MRQGKTILYTSPIHVKMAILGATMTLLHIFLALIVVLVWGLNFLFVKLGLQEIPPLLLVALRFFVSSIPAIFFVRLPKESFKLIATYGLVMFGLQFALIFMGMYAGMTPGMASIIVQVQVFFSMLFATILLGEKPYVWQVAGALVSFAGIALVAFHFDKNVSLIGFICILAAAATWGYGNLITKKARNINMMALVVWGSFVACVPMFVLSLIFEGPAQIVTTFTHITWSGIIAVLYIVYVSTWIGYGVWNWLLTRHTIAEVAPFTLLVPIVALICSALLLGEPLYPWKLDAGVLVLAGLCINLLGARLFAAKLPAVS